MSFAVGPIKLEMRDKDGNIVSPVVSPPRHHLGFRFYRLSQASDDLFDAYRNMYLAFELMLSARHPKGKEREVDWLRASLTASFFDLDLDAIVPKGTANPVEHIIDVVYQDARLPLFHAKDSRAYFAPFTSQSDRASIGASLQLLTMLVMQMASAWHNTRRMRGGMNLKLMQSSLARQFAEPRFVATSDPAADRSFEIDHPVFKSGPCFAGEFRASFAGADRPNVAGTLNLGAHPIGQPIRAVHILIDGGPAASHRLEAVLDLDGFDLLETVAFVRLANATEPRTFFSR
jgi:hypothetical protein